MSCPVCKEKLVISKDIAHGRKFLVCPKMDKASFTDEEVVHYRKSLKRA
jgi:ssDNA-binding Zn-finger/Zn-ribbon topoisomerase 1